MSQRLTMRKIQEVLRLKFEQHRGHRTIAASCGIGVATVSEYLKLGMKRSTIRRSRMPFAIACCTTRTLSNFKGPSMGQKKGLKPTKH
jgi:DNA-binding transcriptional regulator LsrR (DeoR family)